MKPNRVFEDIRADEVAETWDGVSMDLYRSLWNKIVPHQKPLSNYIDIEDSCPNDAIGIENLASHWNKLTEDEQAELNRLADIRDKEFEEWRAKNS